MNDYAEKQKRTNEINIRNVCLTEAEKIGAYGRWINVYGDGSLYECSLCHSTLNYKDNFCPYCGSAMRNVR